MANSKIILTFHYDLTSNQKVGFKMNQIGASFIINFDYIWKPTRIGFGQVTVGTPVAESPGTRSAINFATAFNTDWNFSGTQYAIMRAGNVVTIESNFSDKEFHSFYCEDDTFPPLVLGSVTAEIINQNAVIVVDSSGFSQSAISACSNVFVSVLTSKLATRIVSPISVDPNGSNPFTFDFLRGQIAEIGIEDVDGNQVVEFLRMPSILDPNAIDLQVSNTPAGTTILINNDFYGLELQYSIDNINWQISNSFTGLLAGDYTLYVKDQLGCELSIPFTASEAALLVPYFYISKSNSLRFANRINFGDSGNYKNDENTLSCEVDVPNPWHEVQLFNSSDIITTQFKSNYQLNKTYVIDGLNTIEIPVVKKSNNIGVKDLRDARKYDLGNGYTGIYFTTGAIYNLDSGLPAGENHYLNGLLPRWGKIGNYVIVDNEWFAIENILFDEMKNAEVLVISNNYSGLDVPVKAGSLFNIFNYEVYEFQIDMGDYLNKSIQVKIQASTPAVTPVELLSEEINIQVKHPFTFEINYWNDDNTDVFYATGIRHKIRIPYYKKSGDVEDSSDTHKTDTTSILLSSEIYELDEFLFEPVTKEIWRKLMIALSCKNVIIDGVYYVKNDAFDTNGPLEDTNLYVLTAKMIKTAGVFNSQGSGSLDFDTSNSEVPGLIDVGSGGFVRY